MTIAGETLRLAPGELVFFQPGEPHACRPVGEERLDWRGLHVPQEVMERAAEAVTGRQFAPHFTPSVLPGSELTSLFREVWELVAGEQGELRREEAFLLLVGRLLERCGGCPRPPEEVRPEVRAGFADQSHFNHFFKILTGLTPSQYRAVFAAERGEP